MSPFYLLRWAGRTGQRRSHRGKPRAGLEAGRGRSAVAALPSPYGSAPSAMVTSCSRRQAHPLGDAVLESHVRSCHIMMDLLALDERRTVPAETLSEREIACLQLAGDGQSCEEIAERLGLSFTPSTPISFRDDQAGFCQPDPGHSQGNSPWLHPRYQVFTNIPGMAADQQAMLWAATDRSELH